MHKCITRPQWVNWSPPSAAYMRQWIRSALVQLTACRLFGAKPLPEQMLGYYQLDPEENKLQWNFYQNTELFIQENAFEKVCEYGGHIVQAGGDELRGGNMNSVVRLPNIFQDAVNSLRPSYAIWLHTFVKIGSGNGLASDGAEPLPQPTLT